MNSIRTDYTKQRDDRANTNEWGSVLGRLDVLVDEISRALGWPTRIEEPRDCSTSKR